MKTLSRPPAFSTMMTLVAPATVLGLAPLASEAAAYIKFDGIDGESTDKDHKGWIEIDSFSWEVSRLDKGSKPVATELVIAKKLDRASPLLFLALAKGDSFQKVTLRLTQPADDGREMVYYEMELSDVRLTKHSTDGKAARDERPAETISVVFPKLEITYFPKVESEEPVVASWDFSEVDL